MAAEAGYPNSQYHIGVFYIEGRGVRKNRRLAVHWFRRAAKKLDPDAMHALGYCYRHGRGVKRNARTGFQMELKAAKRDIVAAQFAVGFCLSKGEGTQADPKRAFRWYLTAANKGHSDAAHNLGYLYEIGKGVKKTLGNQSGGTNGPTRSGSRLWPRTNAQSRRTQLAESFQVRRDETLDQIEKGLSESASLSHQNFL
jgi:TPR repeat protein